MKINANFEIFAGVHFDPSKYVPSPAYGVDRFMLDRVGSEMARATTIVRYAPNSKFSEHTHIGGEEFLVLEKGLTIHKGTFKDQHGEFPAGTYVRNPINSKHSPWVDDDGCTIWVKLLQMAETGEGIEPLHVNVYDVENTMWRETVYGAVMTMYQNSFTGELVQVCRIEADQPFPSDEVALNGGEELFIMDGSLILDVGEEYGRWGWLRFPVNGDDKRDQITAGSNGAQVFRKTGHLTAKALSMEKIQVTEEE